MFIKTIPTGQLETNCYIVSCGNTNEAVIIDPGYDDSKIISFIESNNLKIKYILLTHGHFDHCGGLSGIKAKFDVPVAINSDDLIFVSEARSHAKLYGIQLQQLPLPNNFLQEGDCFKFGKCELKTVFTPGHTPGSVCFVSGNTLFSGDTLFKNSIGRTDLPGGSYQNIIKSIKEKLYALSPQTSVFPGHGPETTIADEVKFNPYTC